MMMRKDDLALSLSLGGAREEAHQRAPAFQLNLVPSPAAVATSPSAFLTQHKSPAAATLWTDLLASSSSEGRSPTEMFGGNTTRPFLKGIDVNRAPAADRLVPDEEEEAGVSSPNSTVSSVVSGSGLTGSKRSDRGEDQDHLHHPGHRPNSGSIGDESELARAGSRGISDEEDGGEGSRKKLRLSKEQSAVLEESFKDHNTLNPKQKLALAKQLNLRPRQVEVWFQNRRARTKLKQTEVDCEFLKRCCENLTEENRRLQKEVQELRALKLSPQLYMHMTPPTTLTMCPSCERVAVSASSTPAPSADNRAPHAGAHPLRPQHQLQARPLLPDQSRAVPMTSAGAGHSLPWAPTPLRAAAFVDTPHPRS
ncbi:hypothetical protein Taro_040972 [Colocasia esculenta]|uniref:Homeobox domain-containing protein n=1 Tax=Colocasia esculenta TaxID=4460 RepID=A0A843WNF7_COLES|nr:hypothetical protein [Colocasia esculenta]